MKKFFALVMTLAMLSALAIPIVNATNITSAGASHGTSYGGVTVVPTITVQLTNPNSSDANITANATKLLLNPYGVKVASGSSNSSVSNALSGVKAFEGSETAQVISSPLVVKSTGDTAIALIVSAAKATKSTNVTLLSKAPGKSSSQLEAYLYLRAETVDSASGKYPDAYAAANGLILSDTAQSTPKTLLTMEAPASSSEPVFAQIGIGGALATNVANNGTPINWTNADTVGVEYTLTITPSVAS